MEGKELARTEELVNSGKVMKDDRYTVAMPDFLRESPHLHATRALLTNFRTQSTRRDLISVLQYVKDI